MGHHVHHHTHNHVEARCEVMRRLDELDQTIGLKMETIMAAIDDLKTAIAGLITEGTSDISALVTQINAAVNQDPAIVALTQQVTDATTAMHTAFTGVTGTPLPPPA
jgi:uncharacterized phage infection (PIP) family protein YhgE